MLKANDLISKIKKYDHNADFSGINKAFDLAVRAHGTQLRASGDPYYHHPVEVAMILAEMKFDSSTIITAILHDTIEDTDVTYQYLEKEFGEEIAKLVDGVTKLTKIEYQPETIRQAENFRKLLLAMSEDIRVLLVKLADRLHNMRTLNFIKAPEKRRRIAVETMEIYAPLAERMGMQKIKDELQDLAFAEINPEGRNSIISRLSYLRKQGGNIIEKIVAHLAETMKQSGLKNAEIYGREKSPYSIWRKMEHKNISFEQLADIMAFRIMVDTLPDCYHALGAVHSAYHMIPESFKDFISTPKENGYKSLHTIVMGPEQERIEVQIRTKEMHEIAEMGVAAHWSYKQGSDYSSVDGKQFKWVRELLHIFEQASGPEDLLENTKLEMYHDQVFCFTPKGKLIALPKSSTSVDFAFAVHSDVGRTCVGAKVNGRIVPLRTTLSNGDQVEIIRSKTQVPSPSWEKFVVTGKAKSEVRKFVRAQARQEYLNLGRTIISKALKAENIDYNDKLLEPVLKIFDKKQVEDLLVAVGEGLIGRGDVIKSLIPEEKKSSAIKTFFKMKKKEDTGKNAIPIKGLIPGMALHFAGCCHPIPGDKIIGIVNTGKGITIHTSDCEMLENYVSTPERWVEVAWDDSTGGDGSYVGRLKAIVSHESGTLAEVTQAIAKDDGNITNLKVVGRSNDFFELLIDIEVKDIKHLSSIMTNLRMKSCVHMVERGKV